MNKTIELLKDVVVGLVKTVKLLRAQQKSIDEVGKKIAKLPSAVDMSKNNDKQTELLEKIAEKELRIPEQRAVQDKVEIKNKVKLDDESTRSIAVIVTEAIGSMTKAFTKAMEALKMKWPVTPKEAISVRLSDGENFYRAGGGAGSGGGPNKISIKETVPTDPDTKLNPSYIIYYNAANEVVKIDKVIGSSTFTRLFDRTDDTVDHTLPISSWA
jgi:hypothetical protein